MSRIAGVFTHPAHPPLAETLLAKVSGQGWTQVADTLTGATMGWTGLRSPNLAVMDQVIAVVDGNFYNPDDWGLSPSLLAANAAAQLIALYERHGFVGALQRINGDFAIALFDAKCDLLWLGRDRVGHRPLYYVQTPHHFGFCSRPRALLTIPGVSAEINRRFVAVFAGSHYRYIDNYPEESPYAAVKQLPAATTLCLHRGNIQVEPYWQLTDLPDWQASEAELAEQYRDLLLDAVAKRVSAFPNASFTLSGGLDSSSVMSCAVAALGEKQHAFSSVYRDKTYDESDDIQNFLPQKVAEWHPIRVDDFDLFDTVSRLVAAHDEPVATATWLSHYLLCEAVAEQGFPTLFGGLGGDELNAGEYEYFIFHFADLRAQGREAELEQEIAAWAIHHNHPIYQKNRQVAEQALARTTHPSQLGVILPNCDRMTRYYQAISPDFYDLNAFVPQHDHPFQSWLRNRTYQDIFRETAPCCLRAEDRNCMAFGLNHADPFFDHRLIEFMFRVPGSMKIRGGVTKQLLRQAMQGILPEETRTRIKKTGWNAPAHLWFSSQALEQLLDMVHSQGFRDRGIFNVNEVLRLIKQHQEIVSTAKPLENHMMFLWQLVNVELWLQSLLTSEST
jgi:asparagine synthase (glutamine-hydrolysing)